MANIFSGVLGGGGSNPSKLAYYQQQLRDYQDAKDAQQQQEAVQAMDPYLKQVLQEMSPERANMIMLQRQMMKNPATFDQGSQGFGQMMQQRGTTIADILRQDKATEEAIERHQYKVENPIQGQGGHKLEYAIAYAGGKEKFDALSDVERKQVMDRASRARQLVDRGTYWEDLVTGEQYSKNVGDVETTKILGRNIGERLTNFKTNRKSANAMVQGFQDSLAALNRLNEGANAWTTGYGAFLRYLPKTDAREWFANLEQVNAQTVLDTMKELKSMSQTGSTGFGAVNIKELEVMMNKWGVIDEFMDDEDIKDVIERRIEIMDKINKRAMDAWQQEQDWYRRNRYSLPKNAQEVLDEPGTGDESDMQIEVIPEEQTIPQGFSIIPRN